MDQTGVQPQVLIVENESIWRDTVGRLLSDKHCLLKYANSFFEAETYLRDPAMEFDVIITNLFLAPDSPLAEGLGVLRMVRDLRSKTQCIILTYEPRVSDSKIIINQYRHVVCGILVKTELEDGKPLRDMFDEALSYAKSLKAHRAGIAQKEKKSSSVLVSERDADSSPVAFQLHAIRSLLLAAFSAKELLRFCQDEIPFQPIHNRFGPGYGLDDMVDEVINYCNTRNLFPELLQRIEKLNPPQYERFRSGAFD